MTTTTSQATAQSIVSSATEVVAVTTLQTYAKEDPSDHPHETDQVS